MNKKELKAVTEKFAAFKEEGEEKLREAIIADEAKYSDEDTDAIVKAVLGGNDSPSKYIVIRKFRDSQAKGVRVYIVGDDVSHFDAERLSYLEKRGLIEKK